MRISDWSSDVCSSDLVAHVGEELAFCPAGFLGLAERGLDAALLAILVGDVAARAAVAHETVLGIEDRLAVDLEPHLVAVQQGAVKETAEGFVIVELAAVLLPEQDVEIGRASGRERVCQYV